MFSRNRDLLSFSIGLASGIISFISLLFTCVGVGLPSWYRGTNANNTDVIVQANLFSACYAPTVNQGIISSTMTCTSYSSFSCSTTSYQNSVLNVTAYISGCTNPTRGSSLYISYPGPIYQILIDDYYRLRSSAALSIVSILFILFSTVSAFITAIIVMNIYLVFLTPIFAFLSVLFGVCCLVTAGSVFNYTGAGFALFVVGILLELIVTTLMSIIAARLNQMGNTDENKEHEQLYTNRIDSPVFVRRVYRRKN